MASDPNGGAPFAPKQRLTSTAANILRANDLIQLDTDGGSRAMSAKLTLTGAGVFELGDRLMYTGASHSWYQDFRGASIVAGITQNDVDEVTSTNTTANEAVFGLVLPQASRLTAVGFVFRTGGSHAAGLPETMPRIVVQSRLLSTGAVTDHETYTDPTATFGAYDVSPRLIEATVDPNLTVDRSLNNYKVKFRFEGGANAVANGSIIGIKVTALLSEQAKY